MTDPKAIAVVNESTALRRRHPTAPVVDVLDLVTQGRHGQHIDFGDVSPISTFGLLVVEAFDQGMPLPAIGSGCSGHAVILACVRL